MDVARAPTLVRIIANSILIMIRLGGWRARPEGVEAAEEGIRAIREQFRGQPILFYHWSEDELSRLVFARLVGRGFGADVAYVCDDTWGGRIGAAILRKEGRRAITFRASHPTFRIEDMRALIREPGPLSISADGRGPYGHVNPSLPKLIRRRSGLAVPVSVQASRSLLLFHPAHLRIPSPGAQLAIAIGAPITGGIGSQVSIEALEMGLRDVCRTSAQLLANSGSRPCLQAR